MVSFFCLVFVLKPGKSYACSKKATNIEQQSCSKEESKDSKKTSKEEKDCCKTKSCKHSKNNQGHCNGNCNNKSCNSASGASIGLLSLLEIKTKSYFTDVKKQKIISNEDDYSSCYFSIWLPPKIA